MGNSDGTGVVQGPSVAHSSPGEGRDVPELSPSLGNLQFQLWDPKLLCSSTAWQLREEGGLSWVRMGDHLKLPDAAFPPQNC